MLIVLLGVWGAWLFRGEVAVYVRSESARLEVEHNAVPVHAPVDGVVAECGLRLGRLVHTGDVLARLESRSFELQSQEKRAEIAGRKAAVEVTRHQIEVEEAAREVVARVVLQTARTGKARVAANRRGFELKQQETDAVTRLREADLASKLEALRTVSEAESLKMQALLASEQAALETSSATTTLRDRDVKIAALKKQLLDAENALAFDEARLATLDFEVERRAIRATADGTLADIVACTPGMTVTAAARLATLVPRGDVRVVAYFKPNESVGRIKHGQTAIVRVENFPWTQYGTLLAEVTEVGSEPRDGRVRVELKLPNQDGPIPAMHGLVATTEVRTEQLSPARLLLRLAGQPWTESNTSNAVNPSSGHAPLEAAKQ
jgi:membrane fusion protein (multidrug efflux system)